MILTDDHPPRLGGVSIIVARVARVLALRGHEVRVYARYRASLEQVEGTVLARVWGPSFGRYGGHLLAGRALRALLTADRVLASTWPVATALPRLGLDYDVLAHGSDVTRPPHNAASFARVWGGAAGKWAMSRFLQGALQDRGVAASVLPAPVELASQPTAQGTGWVLVARGTALKGGGNRFVRWVAHAKVPGVVVGDGPALPAWQALAASLGADIRFVGAQPEAQTREIVGAAALCVLAPRIDGDGSGAEGFGLALVEAAALGVPAVGCNTGGVPDALGPGLLLEAPDQVERSVEEILSWWTPERGAEAWSWASAHHGTARTVDHLERRAGNP